jgi:hypothetical protein
MAEKRGSLGFKVALSFAILYVVCGYFLLIPIRIANPNIRN